jgi:hypothetical protein
MAQVQIVPANCRIYWSMTKASYVDGNKNLGDSRTLFIETTSLS